MRVIYIIIRNIVSYILFESNYSNIVYFFECFVSAFYKDFSMISLFFVFCFCIQQSEQTLMFSFSYYLSLRILSFLYYSLYLLFIHFFSFLTFSQIHSCVIIHIIDLHFYLFLFKVGYDAKWHSVHDFILQIIYCYQ